MPTSSPRIAVLGAALGIYHGIGLDHLGDLAALLAAPPYDVVLLNTPGAQAGELLRVLRMEPRYRYLPIYCCQDVNPWCKALGDGAPPADPAAVMPLWRLWQERLHLFNHGVAPERFEERVMAWLWLRSRGDVHAVRDTSVAQHYRYPLLEALADGERVNDFVWLHLMQQQGWLEEGELLDRLRLCGDCGSGRLNFVDVCPECQALDIARQPSLHCFTCGHVGPQEHFLKDGLLLCPNCLSRLRHIGSDYDRPLENYRCRGCQAFFVDAEVEARCLDCGEVHAPDKLRVREVRHFRLAEAGRLRCRQGFATRDGSEGFDRLNLLVRRSFHELLDWQLQLVRRHRTPPFALLGIRFVNLLEALEQLGHMRGHALVDGLVERLQEAVRETDRCYRMSEETLWILMPHTDASGLEVVRQRLYKGAERVAGETESRITIRQAGFVAPEDLLEQEDAALLLARLCGQLV
ncbi:diguanylate cyclase domain-containing protein [Ectopseudomonas oleovorans]|uniref:Diguanylate cyclase n=1 Tax=Ectopseudomonas oleovorans TaxID=301 RepID=A0AA42Q7Q4_ECTOL|nr:diguanylate cyclase [Pseudomonas oleovorans]MDH1338780.1 diguanylate cyclase [Pseudomonas oleovorans]MDH1493407.1 diguanylate cyclase [Pseudomonas oleovorans]WGG20687.1 diguanylate cyclase [Pseudomonas oleovorans]